MKQSTVLPIITINSYDGRIYETTNIKCFEGDLIIKEGSKITYYCSATGVYTTLQKEAFYQIDLDAITNYEKSYRDGKLKNIKYFL